MPVRLADILDLANGICYHFKKACWSPMSIKFLDLKAQYDSIRKEIDCAIAGVIDSSTFVLGPSVAHFEEEFARYCKSSHAIGVNSGTSALLLILKGLGIGQGDEVITAANTFIATVAAIIHSGATPVLVDVDPDSRNMDSDLLEGAISSRTRAIMPVHLYGLMADMEAVDDVARRHGLAVIEDAAQAHGAKLDGLPAGSYGRAAGFSFYPGKNLGAYGEGGAVVTSDETLAEIIMKLRDHGSGKKYYHDIIGYNARMEGIQGAILAVKLKYLDRWNNERNRVAARYRERLKGLPLKLPAEFERHYQVYHQFVIETDHRDQLQKYLAEQAIPTLIHYPIPVHKQKGFVAAGFGHGPYPVTENLAGRILSLPIYPELTDEAIDMISSKIYEFFSRSSEI
jgi:dTDP-4-amino-4,6-dideoxygalactose transaminase